MTQILIVDAIKSSIVMTSEIIKDHLPGCSILIANTGQEAVVIAQEKPLSLIITDIDLPDTDGITLTKYLRQTLRIPILITTFPEQQAIDAINMELFAYHDAADWIKKPVTAEELAGKLERYVTNKSRIEKQFQTALDAILTSNNPKLKKPPQIKGNILNLSIGGALLELEEKLTFNTGDEVIIALLPESKVDKATSKAEKGNTKAAPTLKKAKAALNSKEAELSAAAKLNAKITWTNKSKNQAEIHFDKLNSKHQKMLEDILRKSSVLG
jgi:CheY-like chemotaxis protein